jgi:hypothetical protein
MGQGADLLHELDAVELGQLVIGEDDVDAVVARELERARRRVEQLEVELAVDLAHDLREQQAAREQIVDDQDRVPLRAGKCELRNDPGARHGCSELCAHGFPPTFVIMAYGKAVPQQRCHPPRRARVAVSRPATAIVLDRWIYSTDDALENQPPSI